MLVCTHSGVKKNKNALKLLIILFICMSVSELISSRHTLSTGHAETLNLFILSIMGRVGIKLECLLLPNLILPMPGRVSDPVFT